MKWMNVKMRALGVLTHSDFKIAFMMDYKSMLTLHTERYGVLLLSSFLSSSIQAVVSAFAFHYSSVASLASRLCRLVS